MPAQPSQTRIVNKALVILGTAQRIGSIGDGSPLAKQAEAVWDECRDEVLVEHPWNFAIARAALPANTDYVPENEYAFAYELPAQCLRWLPWRRDHGSHFEGEQEGRFILSNAAAPIYVRFIVRVEDMARWSIGFNAAMAAKLALYLAKSVTGQSGMMDRAQLAYDEALRSAKRQDGQATGSTDRRVQYRSSWLGARNG